MIPVTVKEGATALERWLINQGRFSKAMKLRAYRGIACFDELTDPTHAKAWEQKYYAKVAKLVGVSGDMITEHITDASDFDRDWQSLQEWMDGDVDYTAYNKKMERREAWLNTLTVSDVHGMGYESDAFLYSRTLPGRWGWDDEQEELWRFPDGDEYRDADGRAYATKLGIINDL